MPLPRQSVRRGTPLFPALSPGRQVTLHRLFVIGSGLALHKSDGAAGTLADTVPEPVAVGIAHEPRLAVHDADRSLVAGVGAQAAPVTFALVDLDDPPHVLSHRSCPPSQVRKGLFLQIRHELPGQVREKPAEDAASERTLGPTEQAGVLPGTPSMAR
jgi:hypothetical protein